MTHSRISGFKVHSIDKRNAFNVDWAYTVPRLNTPIQEVDIQKLQSQLAYLQGIDIPSVMAKEVTVLLGMEVPGAHMHLDYRKPPGNVEGPIGLRTPFVCCLIGSLIESFRYSYVSPQRRIRHLRSPSNSDLQETVNRFWTTESLGIKAGVKELVPKNDQRAIELLNATTKNVGGRYEVGLLWKSPGIQLPNNYNAALRRQFSVERRFKKDPAFAERYRLVIEGHIARGHARKVPLVDFKGPAGRTWYLPQHGVVNPNKPEKLRVVFDGSSRFHDQS